MKVIAYDPYASPAKAGLVGAQLVGLDELLAQSDFITVHLPKTPESPFLYQHVVVATFQVFRLPSC